MGKQSETIRVSQEVHATLHDLKDDRGHTSVDSVIRELYLKAEGEEVHA